jgi:hypothetical protein
VLGAIALATGVFVAMNVSGSDSIRTTPELIATPDCPSVIMEITEARISLGTSLDFLNHQGHTAILVTPIAEDQELWKVGSAPQQQVEDRLLGATYCLARSTESGWEISTISVAPDAPSVDASDLSGLWAQVPTGEKVIIDLDNAAAGVTTVLITSPQSGNARTLTSIEIAGEYRIEGASTAATIAIVAGGASAVIGLALLLISTVVLRKRGKHETSVADSA